MVQEAAQPRGPADGADSVNQAFSAGLLISLTPSGCSLVKQRRKRVNDTQSGVPLGAGQILRTGIGCLSFTRSFSSRLKLLGSVSLLGAQRVSAGGRRATTQEMELSAGNQKMPVGMKDAERGLPCLKCKGACTGFQLHSWRKSCDLCHCPREDHALPTEVEEDHRVGQLLSDTCYSGLTARVKGSDGMRVYKRNRMIITNPITSRKDPTFLTVTYEWAPPGLNQKLAMRYMELIPKNLQPVAGTEGAHYRRLQLLKQLPAYDFDPHYCRGLSEGEKPVMEAFLKQTKENVMGVAEVTLPCSAKQDEKEPNATKTANSIAEEPGDKKDYLCEFCQQLMPTDAPAVYAERAGYKKQWHPACFVCCQCKEPLVNLIYFWKGNRPWCGRHYCESERPRCNGCDEIIFSQNFQQHDGKSWHLEHFTCTSCEQSLNDKPYVLDKALLLCTTCSSNRSTH